MRNAVYGFILFLTGIRTLAHSSAIEQPPIPSPRNPSFMLMSMLLLPSFRFLLHLFAETNQFPSQFGQRVHFRTSNTLHIHQRRTFKSSGKQIKRVSRSDGKFAFLAFQAVMIVGQFLKSFLVNRFSGFG